MQPVDSTTGTLFRRKLLLFVLTSVLALVVGFFTFTPAQAMLVVSKTGAWFMSGIFAFWLWSLWKVGEDRKNWKWRREFWAPALLIVVGSVVSLVHEPYRFKVLNDELVLAGNSMRIHFEREIWTVSGAHSLDGTLYSVAGILDKRPFFFVFLVSVVHDLTGYRLQNVFILNSVLTVVALVLFYGLAHAIAGRKAAMFSLLLLIGLPLFAQNATGGGFEILNMVMILASCLLGLRYVRRRDDNSLNAFVLAVVLLAQTRYESVLFVFSAALVIIQVWWSERKISLPAGVLVSPLLLVMYPLQHKMLTLHRAYWQLPEGLEHPFGLQFFYDNVGHAMAFFFSRADTQSNSWLLSLLGVMGIFFFWMLVWSKRKILEKEHPAILVFAAFALLIMANFFLLMCYHWGQLDQFIVARLSLPLQLFMALAAGIVLNEFLGGYGVLWRVAFGVGVLGIYAVGVPHSAKANATRQEVPTSEVAWQTEVISKQDRHDVLYIMRTPMVAVIQRKPAIGLPSAKHAPEGMAFHLKHGTYREIYVFQRLEYNVGKAEWFPSENEELSEEFVLETLDEHPTGPMVRNRMSRLVAVNPSKVTAEEKNKLEHDSGKTIQEIYYEKYYRSLPW